MIETPQAKARRIHEAERRTGGQGPPRGHGLGQVERRRRDPHHARRERRLGDGPRRRGCPVGIFTERDVVRLYAEGDRDFDSCRSSSRMTCSLVVGRLSMSVDEALGLMTERRFRHLPVVEDGKLLGLVSIGDLVKMKLNETRSAGGAGLLVSVHRVHRVVPILKLDALVGDHPLHRRALEHAVLEGAVVLELGHRQPARTPQM